MSSLNSNISTAKQSINIELPTTDSLGHLQNLEFEAFDWEPWVPETVDVTDPHRLAKGATSGLVPSESDTVAAPNVAAPAVTATDYAYGLPGDTNLGPEVKLSPSGQALPELPIGNLHPVSQEAAAANQITTCDNSNQERNEAPQLAKPEEAADSKPDQQEFFTAARGTVTIPTGMPLMLWTTSDDFQLKICAEKLGSILEGLSCFLVEIPDDDLRYLQAFAKLKLLAIPLSGVSDRSIPAICSASQLESLDVSGCPISDASLQHLLQLPQLRRLNLSATEITAKSALVLKELHNLQALGLGELKISEASLASIANLSNLRSLCLSKTPITDYGLASLIKLDHLEILDISGTDITSEGLRSLQKLAKLKHLNLSQCHAITSGLSCLPDSLSSLYLDDIKQTLPFDELSHLIGLKTLTLGTTPTDAGNLRCLKPLVNLEFLMLVGTDLGEQEASELRQLDSLWSLSLSKCNLSAGSLSQLISLPQLSSLSLDNTNFTDEHAKEISRFKSLQELDLSHTPITSYALAQLSQCSCLSRLDLENTAVTDSELAYLSNLKELRSLNLRGTQVTIAGIARLQTALPKVKVTADSEAEKLAATTDSPFQPGTPADQASYQPARRTWHSPVSKEQNGTPLKTALPLLLAAGLVVSITLSLTSQLPISLVPNLLQALLGNADAQHNLGHAYLEGTGWTPKNYKKAAEWFQRSAEIGNPHAQFDLGRMYKNGLGLPKDIAKSLDWYKRSADQGNSSAQCNLGRLYVFGDGVSADFEEGIKLLRKSADQDNEVAQRTLAEVYDRAIGVTRNQQKAIELYRKAAEQGDAYSQWRLAEKYESGSGVEKSWKDAAAWYRKAAQQGNRNAQYNLATLYLLGAGVQQNDTEALNWYRKAAKAGNVNAKEYLQVEASNANNKGSSVNFGPYMQRLQSAIKAHWSPVKSTRMNRAVVVFSLSASGQMENLKLERSSGNQAQDAEALAAVRNAATFLPLPKGAPAPVKIQFTFDYNLFDKNLSTQSGP